MHELGRQFAQARVWRGLVFRDDGFRQTIGFRFVHGFRSSGAVLKRSVGGMLVRTQGKVKTGFRPAKTRGGPRWKTISFAA